MRLGKQSVVHLLQKLSTILWMNSYLCRGLLVCTNGPLGTRDVERPSKRSLGHRYDSSSGEVGCLPIGLSFIKGSCKNLGPHLTEKAAQHICNSESGSRAMLDNMDQSVNCIRKSGRHTISL